ncbi:MAG: hypothetical protein KA354_13215 [Phycisphaerae bacterium]|nr:hypothetical protein [Phycisphaerae bacterium]
MTRTQCAVVALVACVAMMGLVTPAEAVTITVDGTVVFDAGGFEADTPGQLPGAAAVGTWNVGDNGDTRCRVVDNAPIAGAYEGAHALNFYRNEGDSAGATAVMASASTVGQTVKVTTMLYLQEFALPGWETKALSAQFGLLGGGLYLQNVQFGGGGVLQYYAGGWQSTSLTASFGAWHLLEVEYLTGADALTVTLDGGASVSIPAANVLASVDSVLFQVSNWYNDWYLDAVPADVLLNDTCARAMAIGDGTYGGSTALATADGTASCGTSDGTADVWYKVTPFNSGTLALATCGSEFDTVLSVYSSCGGGEIGCSDNCAGSPCGGTDSCLSVSVTAGSTYFVRVSGVSGAKGTYTLSVTTPPPPPPPPNDSCENAAAIGDGTVTGSTTWATGDGDASCGNSGTAVDVWYAYTATCDGVLSADTCGSAYNTVLSVHGECPGTLGNTLACSDDCAGTSASCLQTPVVSGQVYLIRVAGNGTARGDFTLHTSCGPATTTLALPLVQAFETDPAGSTGGWEVAPSLVMSPPPICSSPPLIEVITTDPSPAGGGTHSLKWFEPAGGTRSGVGLRWMPPASSTTGIMKLSYDFKIVQHTNRGLSFCLSGFAADGTLNLNVYGTRFDSTTDDGLPIGWNWYYGGEWHNIIPVTDVNQVIGHWFRCSATVDVGARTVDLTMTPLDDGGVGGHVLGEFGGGNPLDMDMANYTGFFVFQANPAATSEVIFDNLRVEIVGQEVCHPVWADHDGDNDVDQVDFGAFQACFTGATTGLLPGCYCFDRDKNSTVDRSDFASFELCVSGPSVPADTVLCAP